LVEEEEETDNVEELLKSRQEIFSSRLQRSESSKVINLDEEVNFPNHEKLKIFL
jgi:hypothetical protein